VDPAPDQELVPFVTVLGRRVLLVGIGCGLCGSVGFIAGRLHTQPHHADSLSSSTATPATATGLAPRSWVTVAVAAAAPTIRGLDGDWVYPCADPANVCEHLASIGCVYGLLPACRGETAQRGEDVCLKLYDAKTDREVKALGSKCSP